MDFDVPALLGELVLVVPVLIITLVGGVLAEGRARQRMYMASFVASVASAQRILVAMLPVLMPAVIGHLQQDPDPARQAWGHILWTAFRSWWIPVVMALVVAAAIEASTLLSRAEAVLHASALSALSAVPQPQPTPPRPGAAHPAWRASASARSAVSAQQQLTYRQQATSWDWVRTGIMPKVEELRATEQLAPGDWRPVTGSQGAPREDARPVLPK